MTHLNYIITRPGEANGDAVPIEAHGAGDIETLTQMEGQGWKNANGWTPPPYKRSGDEWATFYYDAAEDLIKDRPDLPDISAPASAPATLDLSMLPGGSAVTVVNEGGDELALSLPLTEALSLDDPGKYVVRVSPPFPWLPIVKEMNLA